MDSPAPTSPAVEPVASPPAAPDRAPAPRNDREAADRLASLWDAGGFDGATRESRTESAPSTPPEDSEPSPPSGEQPSEDAEPAPIEPAAWEDLDGYFVSQQIDPTKAKRRVKVDGKEMHVPDADLVKAYELSQAGHARLAEAAKARAEFDAQRQQAIQFVQQRAQQIEALANGLKQQVISPYEQYLQTAQSSGDKVEIMYAERLLEQANTWYTNQVNAVVQARQQEALAQSQQALKVQQERMLTARPDWRDASRFEADSRAMREYGAGLGFSDAELGTISDHRHLLVLDTAARAAAAQQAAAKALGRDVSLDELVSMATELHKLQASQPEVTKRVAAAPQMSKPGTRPTTPKNPAQAKIAQLKADAKKSGYQSDAANAALLESLFR